MFDNIKIKLYGESHADKIGVQVKGLDGLTFDVAFVEKMTSRRKAGHTGTTSRVEKDEPIIKGVEICDNIAKVVNDLDISFENKDVKRVETAIPRPSHADYVAYLRYGYIPSGGGEFSGRMTTPLCVVGGIAKSVLESKGIYVTAYLSQVGDLALGSYKDSNIALDGVCEKERERLQKSCATLDESKQDKLTKKIEEIKKAGDSVGGKIECVIQGVKEGCIGGSYLGGLESKIASAVYAIPGVKGVEFGKGFDIANALGSEVNDGLYFDKEGRVKTCTNNSGGINGGIANGMPILMSVALRPTPTIEIEQDSVDLSLHKNVKIKHISRNDTCIAIRAVAPIESMIAIAILDEVLNMQNACFNNAKCNDKVCDCANADKLSDARKEIDCIDEEIAKLIDKRMSVAKNIAKIKREEGIAVLDESRENAVLEKVSSLVGDECKDAIKSVYKTIMQESKNLQIQYEDSLLESLAKSEEDISLDRVISADEAREKLTRKYK